MLLSSDNLLTGYQQLSHQQFNQNLSTCVLLAKDWFMLHKLIKIQAKNWFVLNKKFFQVLNVTLSPFEYLTVEHSTFTTFEKTKITVK